MLTSFAGFLILLASIGIAATIYAFTPTRPRRPEPTTYVHPRTLDHLRRQTDRGQERNPSRPYLKD